MIMVDIEGKIIEILTEKGPVNGKELYLDTYLDSFQLWRTCKKSKAISILPVGNSYLRFDKKVQGFARLSPAIQREFLTYSVIGLKSDMERINERCLEVKNAIKGISQEKMKTAKRAVDEILEKTGEKQQFLEKNSCFVIGGDVPLGMAHSEPRPEISTGIMVNGSDLDIIVIYLDDLEPEALKALETVFMDVKYQLLNRPNKKEELDFIIKDLTRTTSQMEFTTFEDLIACKILDESVYLAGNHDLFLKIKEMLQERGIPGKLRELKNRAEQERARCVRELLLMEEIDEDFLLENFTTTMEESEIF